MKMFNKGDALWRTREADFPVDGSDAARARFLLRYATLAPSTRNTQPWRFTVRGPCIDIGADLDRWQPVADPDRRELEISLGCALENLIVAADQYGYACAIDLESPDAPPARVARVTIAPAPARAPRMRPSGLFSAIVKRRTSHDALSARPLRPAHRRALDGVAREPGVELWYSATSELKMLFGTLNAAATAAAFHNPAFRHELADQIGRGAFGTGPAVSYLGRAAMRRLDLGAAVARRESRRIAGAATLGVITTATDTRAARIRAGQVFERVWLLATSLGVALQPMSQLLEDSGTRARVASTIASGQQLARPPFVQQVFRLGYTAHSSRRHTPRRPIASVIAEGAAPR